MDIKIKKDFLSAVKSQCESYTKLKQFIAAQQKALVSKDSGGLESLAKKQEELITEIQKKESEKKLLLEKMAAELGLKYTPDLKLQEVLAKSADKDSAEIENETVKLIGLIKESAALNMNNSRLMKNFLDFMDFSAGLRDKIENPVQSLYTPEGVINTETQVKPRFDKKI